MLEESREMGISPENDTESDQLWSCRIVDQVGGGEWFTTVPIYMHS